MVSEFAVKSRRNHLSSSTLGTSDNGNDAFVNVSSSNLVVRRRGKGWQGKLNHTKCYDNAKQAAYNPVDHPLKLRITRLCAIQSPVRVLLLQPETEEIRFRNDKVKILVEELRDMFGRSGSCSFRSELFKKDSG